jgi:hypothetical protein
MKLRIWGDDPDPEVKRQYDEADAIKGRYTLEDLKTRKLQHLINTLPSTIPQETNEQGDIQVGTEEEIDTALRQLSVVTNGAGSLGKDFPISPENRVAFERMVTITRWCKNTLAPTNRLRIFMTAQFNDKFHTNFDRAVERDEPEVALTYKPMIYPGPTAPVQTANDQERENAKKKP